MHSIVTGNPSHGGQVRKSKGPFKSTIFVAQGSGLAACREDWQHLAKRAGGQDS